MSKNKAKVLFEDDESEEETVSFKTHNEYAKRYDAWRQKEELHKLQQKYGDTELNSDGSLETDSEDEEPVEMTPEQEEQFLKTLALLKSKDPRIYDSNYQFFKEDDKAHEETTVENIEDTSKPKKKLNSLAAAFADSDDDDDDEGIFKVEKKELPERKPNTNKEEQLKQYLIGAAAGAGGAEADLAPLRALWTDPLLADGEKFLRDYVLTNKVTEDVDLGEDETKLLDSDTLEADEKIVEEQGQFERAYNFRFEEPDQEYLKRYPRTVEGVRPADGRRARRRLELRLRRRRDKEAALQDIARIRALKRQEIQLKLDKIREVTGNDALAFQEEDVSGEWDPEEHDRRMSELFDESYYCVADETKPRCPDVDQELEIENWEEYDPDVASDGDAQPHCDDAEFNMDADAEQPKLTLMEEIKSTLGKKRRSRKRKSRLAQVLSAAAAAAAPRYRPGGDGGVGGEGGGYSRHLDRYYRMECEDIVAGVPTRFKYRQVEPNDFGLTVEEILLADDKELNKWAPLHKAVSIRAPPADRAERDRYRRRAGDPSLKRRVLPSLFRDLPPEPELVQDDKERLERSKNGETRVINETTEDSQTHVTPRHDQNDDTTRNETAANGADVTKIHRNKHKKKKLNGTMDKNENTAPPESGASVDVTDIRPDPVTNEKVKKKRKKRKLSQGNVHNTEELKVLDGGRDDNLKRKYDGNIDVNSTGPAKKRKRNKKKNHLAKLNKSDKFKSKATKFDTTSSNPLSKLSNERLKAYGLNPKKYRSFLKYKKF